MATAVALILIYVLWESYGQFLPLVETLMVPLAMLSVCQFARLAFDRPEDARNNLLLLGCIIVFSVALGLTMAPTLLFWSIAAVFVYAVRRRGYEGDNFPPSAAVYVSLVLLLVFSFWTLKHIGLNDLLYWAIVNPHEALGISLRTNIIKLFTALPDKWLEYSRTPTSVAFKYVPILSLLQFGFVAIASYCVVLLRYPTRIVSHFNSAFVAKVMVVTFGGVLAVGFVLTGWRSPYFAYDHKKVAAMGISIAVMALSLRHLVDVANEVTNRLPSFTRETSLLFHAMALLLASVVFVVLSIISCSPYLAPRSTSLREAAFDQAKICKLGERGNNCYCVLQLTFDSRRFLQYDVQPCLGFSPEQPHMIFRVEKSRLQLLSAVENRNIAFLLGRTSHETTIYGIPEEVYNRAIEIRVCRPLQGNIYQICSAS